VGLFLGHAHFFLQSTVLRRDVLMETGLFKAHLSIAEDRDVIARMALRGPFSFCRDVVVHILRRSESIEHLGAQRITRAVAAGHAFAEVYAGLMTHPGLTRSERRLTAESLCRIWRGMGNLLIVRGDRSGARGYFRRAFLLRPSVISAIKYGATLLPQRYSELCVRTAHVGERVRR